MLKKILDMLFIRGIVNPNPSDIPILSKLRPTVTHPLRKAFDKLVILVPRNQDVAVRLSHFISPFVVDYTFNIVDVGRKSTGFWKIFQNPDILMFKSQTYF